MYSKIRIWAWIVGTIMSSSVFSQPLVDNQAEIVFEKMVMDFGEIQQGQVVNATFTYKNTGKVPLILSNVKTTCGCTVPNWSKEPLAPGQSTQLAATFNTNGKMGQQNKVIAITSNARNGQMAVSIVCNVVKAANNYMPNINTQSLKP
jgi:hypothetical protein